MMKTKFDTFIQRWYLVKILNQGVKRDPGSKNRNFKCEKIGEK